ncbi:MAG: hypothetical protein IPQ14_02125 [Candidatus Microthrix sp.]|uniref:PEP/pyruvate-binding domain-containing protein n=1 Tax=Candidatus Neomicrothrix sp. TaxID=2719034 RepID=UPI002A7E160C|nr:hypothetical protein [Candidatus Microthrix sp.]
MLWSRRTTAASSRCSATGRSPTGTKNGFDHLDVALSVGIQQMVRSDTGSAGVIFTIDPRAAFPPRADRRRLAGRGCRRAWSTRPLSCSRRSSTTSR